MEASLVDARWSLVDSRWPCRMTSYNSRNEQKGFRIFREEELGQVDLSAWSSSRVTVLGD